MNIESNTKIQNDGSELGKNIGILCRQLNVFLNRELENHNISATEIMYLGSLSMHNGISQESLAAKFCVDKAAVARTIAALESKGLVYRQNSNEDKRSKLIFITDKAKNYGQILDDIQNKWYMSVLGDYSKEEIDKFTKMLSEIAGRTVELNH